MRIIFGVTGKYASGKDSFADYLVSREKFVHISLSDFLREDLKRMKKQVTRENLQWIGNDLREKLGGTILAERALARIEPNKNYIITSIGRVDEIETLKRHKDFVMVFVDASSETRFNRMKSRNRENDPKSLKAFLEMEKLENKGGNAQYREIDNCRKKSKIIITNNSSLESFYSKINKLLKNTLKRPDWDEYFFGIMDLVASRGTCNRALVGCVIVRDKHILATGYNGSPKGLPHCHDEGCLIENTLHTDGISRDHCVRTTHAEQNAIAQAAKHGSSIKDSTIYLNMEPCLSCTKMIINSGIKEVVCRRRYPAAQMSRDFLKKAGIKLRVKEKADYIYLKQK